MLRKKNNFVIERYKNKTVLKVECFDKKEGHCGWISPTFYDHVLPGALEFGHRNQKPAVGGRNGGKTANWSALFTSVKIFL